MRSQADGRHQKIGTLTPGKEADIVMLATSRINIFPLNGVGIAGNTKFCKLRPMPERK
jgi:cytosine/adenosine deaminase-related metal-dependent hydrolase